MNMNVLILGRYIGRFKPAEIELETKLRPFIPDYIPSVGEIDAFIKVQYQICFVKSEKKKKK